MKNIQVSNLTYEMLLEISKRKRVKPFDFITQLIEKEYNSK
jgi:hypothetical protein